ncbi:hypothetical protein ACFWBF_00780 [Streptomyces sp. NPDC060028]|uniref:hypothetical protein n=1 Tax=Streptomyces sp. NPDC060028 TaxID=3347041 RepID=UPI0036770B1A
MTVQPDNSNPSSAFALKEAEVQLVPAPRPRQVPYTLSELEQLRVGSGPVSASKHGLESICGASCETGAQ